MFYTRQHFQDCLKVLKAYEKLKSKDEVKVALTNDMAKEMFPDFLSMSTQEKYDILEMLLEDLDIDMYELN